MSDETKKIHAKSDEKSVPLDDLELSDETLPTYILHEQGLKLNTQTDPEAGISIGYDLAIHDDRTISARVGLEGEAFIRVKEHTDGNMLSSNSFTDLGLLRQEVGKIGGKSSFYSDPIDRHQDSERILGARMVNGFNIGDDLLTTTHAAGIDSDGEIFASSSIVRNVETEKWDIAYGAQASVLNGDFQLDLGANATRSFDLGCLNGKFNAAVIGSFGPETICTIASEVDLYHGKTGLSAAFSAAISQNFTDNTTTAEATLGLYKDIDIKDINLGRIGIETKLEHDKNEDANASIGLGIKAPF